eukprot:7385278-Prymnesium_polylepis.1
MLWQTRPCCRVARDKHTLNLLAGGAKIITACPWAGCVAGAAGAVTIPYANGLMLLLPVASLTDAAKALKFLPNAVKAAALSKILNTLLDAGLSLDGVFKGATVATSGFTLWLAKVRSLKRGFSAAQRTACTLEVGDFFATDMPLPPPHSRFIDTALDWGGDLGVVGDDDDMMGAALLEFSLVDRWILGAHRAGETSPYALACKKIALLTDTTSGSAEDKCYRFSQNWALWPDGLDGFELSAPGRRAALEARVN